MPKPYSLDLRERVVGFVEDGQSRRAAAARFRVSVSFVVNLMKAVRARGSFAPKPSGGRRHAKLEPHRAFLLAQVAEKADITMPELRRRRLWIHMIIRRSRIMRIVFRCDPAIENELMRPVAARGVAGLAAHDAADRLFRAGMDGPWRYCDSLKRWDLRRASFSCGTFLSVSSTGSLWRLSRLPMRRGD
jgi:hypothetical protein